MTQDLTHHATPTPAFARLRVLAVATGGAAGAVARAGLAEASRPDGGWPWATFAANMAGTAILAWLVTALVVPRMRTRLWRLLVGTGFCGALTTFSTFQVEVIELAKHERPGLAVGYAAASLIGGLAVALVAAAAGRETSRR